ncbi:Aste57867_2830 [Aphanomyces stellatus]|uniref:Aste57867_2830 protein n=2 Tax=Aphanomyces stellatus TaxID=120398 RepID=A0A485KC64_9STRA|nr:hypothetical protein As57867_002823 [Aphanomyces stellatus]VFT80018.1 Aste57867_2830 [Aphanomyces stellatus]
MTARNAHTHALVFEKQGIDTSVRCSSCNKCYKESWRCEACDYDECSDCFATTTSLPKVADAQVVAAKHWRRNCKHSSLRLVLSTKYSTCGQCRTTFPIGRWRHACNDCTYALCLSCERVHHRSHRTLAPSILVVLDNFEGISTDSSKKMLERVLAVLRANHEEITTMSALVSKVRVDNDAEWTAFNEMKRGLESSKRTITADVARLEGQLAQRQRELNAANDQLADAKTQLESCNATRRRATEEADKKRNGHHLWVAATVVSALVFWPAAIVAGANAIGTHDDLKDLEREQEGHERLCSRLETQQWEIQKTKDEVDRKIVATKARLADTKTRFDHVQAKMTVVRRLTLDLDRFRENLNKMKIEIDEALTSIQYVVRSVGYGSGVALALEASAKQASGGFAIGWQGVDNITRHLKQSNPKLTMDAF